MWDEHPAAMALGLTGWGVNRMNYWFGYWPYYNPYYVEPYYVNETTYIDYSQPLTIYDESTYNAPAEGTATADTTATPPDPAMSAFDEARQAFYDGDYEGAMTACNTALASRPDDAVLHEFRALVLFATGKYRDAAATLHAVLAVGPGWDWTTLSSLYPSVDKYTEQIRALEEYTRQNAEAADAKFVLAYHYMTMGHADEAIDQLKKVLELEPKDEVAAQLLGVSAGPADASTSTPGEAPAPASTEPDVTIPAADLVGTWKASGQGGAQFTLKLDDKGLFTWTYAAGGKTTSVDGVYAVDGANLALQPDAGGTMLAEITPPQNGAFHFQEVGGPASDTGLDFRK
jgi:tetratricopeptide (TPR) repeat protein